MGFFNTIKNFFSGKSETERIRDLAAEVMRYADRYAHAKDYKNAALARDYAERIAKAASLSEANRLYTEFMALFRKQEKKENTYTEREYHEHDDIAIDDDDDDTAEDWSDDS